MELLRVKLMQKTGVPFQNFFRGDKVSFELTAEQQLIVLFSHIFKKLAKALINKFWEYYNSKTLANTDNY